LAADHLSPEALFNLGIIYEIGLGVIPDLREAAKWYRSAESYNDNFLVVDPHSVTRFFMKDVRNMVPDEICPLSL